MLRDTAPYLLMDNAIVFSVVPVGLEGSGAFVVPIPIVTPLEQSDVGRPFIQPGFLGLFLL